MKKRIIWRNTEIEKDFADYIKEEISEGTEGQGALDLAEYLNDDYLEDERANLDIVTNGIIAIADLGLWNGRKSAYKEVGDNIKDCLYSDSDFIEWYVDKYDFKSTQHHHDGTNYIIYREWKNNISDIQKDNFLDLLYSGKATKQHITKYTRSLKGYIKKVYGF